MAEEGKFEEFFDEDDEAVEEKKSIGTIIGEKIGDCMLWIRKNWSIVVMGVAGFFGLLIGVADTAKKNERKRNDHELRYRSIYDAKHRHHVIAKKDIKPSQQRQIDHRIDNGENIYDVCESIGVKLKR